MRGCRPLRFGRERKVLYINGLYRHGFLLTPAIVEEVLRLLSIEGQPSKRWRCLRQNQAETSLLSAQAPFAVAHNEEFVPRGDYEACRIFPGDRIDIVHPTAGG